jgi:hypothetical protein
MGDGIQDYLCRGRSQLSKVRKTERFLLNSLPLRLQIVFCLSHLSHQPVDFCNRRGSEFLNDRGDLRVSFCLRRRSWRSEIANFPFNHQTCGYCLEVRHLKSHHLCPPLPEKDFLTRRLMWCEYNGGRTARQSLRAYEAVNAADVGLPPERRERRSSRWRAGVRRNSQSSWQFGTAPWLLAVRSSLAICDQRSKEVPAAPGIRSPGRRAVRCCFRRPDTCALVGRSAG